MSGPRVTGTAPRTRRPGAVAAEVAEASPWKDAHFRLFAAGNFLNNIGEALYALVLPLLAYDRTGSLQVMALLATAVPLTFVIDPVLGVAVDRWGPRVLVIPGLAVQAAAALTMNMLLLAGALPVPALFTLALIVALGGSAYQTGWITGVPATFPQFPLRARASLNSLYLLTLALGPLLVAAGLQWSSYALLLWFNFATFLAPAVVWVLVIHPSAPRPAALPGRTGYLQLLAAGWRAVVGDLRMRSLLIVRAVLTVAFGAGLIPLVLFRLRSEWTGSAAAGQAVALFSIGMLLGSLGVARGQVLRPRSNLTMSAALFAAASLLMATSALWLFLVGLTLSGVATGCLIRTAVLMPVKYLDRDVLGRGYAVIGVVVGAASLASPPVTVFLSHAVGPAHAFVGLSLAAFGALFFLRFQRW